MYDKYLIVAEAFRNVEDAGKVTGFQIGVRLPYYRGVVLTLVGETVLSIDGEKMDASQMTVTLNGRTYPLRQLENESTNKWEFGEVGIITVSKPGGLTAGEHKMELRQHMKISYVPGGFWGGDVKTLQLAA